MKHTLLLLVLVLTLTSTLSAPAAYGQSAERATAAQVDIPKGYVLSAAYPNPFNPRTSFSLTVEDRQEVAVEIFNLLGQRVRLLYEGIMEAGETRTFAFEAGDLPSGIYLYRVQGQDFTATRQITLLK